MPDLAHYYEVLGLEPGASSDEIKQAWRDLAQVWHPDRFSGNERLCQKAQEQLQEINEAYQVLRDPEARVRVAASTTHRSRRASAPWESHDGNSSAGIDPQAVLREGVNVWNLWRKKYSDITPSLRGAKLRKAELSGVDFHDVDLAGVNLQEADLYKANLNGASMPRALLGKADLSRATLIEADLTKVDFFEADLSGADLSGANLTGAILSGVSLVGTALEGATLVHAVGLTREQVALTSTDEGTRLPAYL